MSSEKKNSELPNAGSSPVKNQLDISPITKGRRILVFLGDFFINFMIAVFLINLVALPIGRVCSNYDQKMEQLDIATENRNSVFFGNQILFYEDETDKIDFDTCLYYTANRYIEYYVFENKSEYEVIRTYFVDLCLDETAYLNIYQTINTNYPFFDLDGPYPVLKQEYKEAFAPAFDELDDMAESAQKQYDSFIENVFLSAYSYVVDSVRENNLSYGNLNYLDLEAEITSIDRYNDVLILASTYISFILASIISFLVYPLINKNGRTMTMSIMKIDRVGINNIFLLKKGEIALFSVYQSISNLLFIILLPVPTIYLAYAFNVGSGSLFILSCFSAFIILVSLIFLLFSQYNQTLFDFFTRSLMIKSEDLDEIYRMKGYMKYNEY